MGSPWEPVAMMTTCSGGSPSTSSRPISMPGGMSKIAQFAGHLGVLDHAPAGDGDLAIVSLRHVHHLLDARDQR